MIGSTSSTQRWPIFICYRQADGKSAAARIFELLNDQSVPTAHSAGTGDAAPVLDVYFDQAAPGVEDWMAVHEPFLKRARAIIVICTPGAKLNEGAGDWVHHEIDWWLANRQMAPILVDPLDQNTRYVPDAIARRWPNAQRIRLIDQEWQGLSPTDRQALDDRVREQFMGGIMPSSDTLYRQELDQETQRAARLRRTRRSMAVLAAVLITTIGAAAWIYTLKTKANIAQQTAEQARNEAEDQRAKAVAANAKLTAAKALIQGHEIESQAARALTEAEYIKILREIDGFEAYRDVMATWEDDFRAHANRLVETAQSILPECEELDRFLVYERQLYGFPLDGAPEHEEMFVYLSRIPGSSPRSSDWRPTVMDIFFADSRKINSARELPRTELKVRMEAANVTESWRLLMGLSTPHVISHHGQTYRVSRRGLTMNEDGDMKMSFGMCLEAPLLPAPE